MADGNFSEAKAANKAAAYRLGRDRIALTIAGAAIVLFVITGGTAVSQAVQSIRGLGLQPNPIAASAMLLNIALILLGWRHHTNLTKAVTVHRHAEAEARQLAETDTLTGMLNRRSFALFAGAQIAENAKCGHHAALIMADLDRFKQINDLHGHAVGDEVLRDCARKIAGILPDRALAARLGGDEFAFLVPLDSAHPDRVDHLAAALIEAIAVPMVAADAKISLTVSLGISRSDQQLQRDAGEPLVEAMLHSADIAMYHAKRQGRHCYFWFEPSMESELRFRRQLEAEIQSGIEHGEFVPYYEQQIDLKTGKLTGFEMLARWKSPKHGIVNPQTFIPIAEDLGVIDVLSEQLIAQALQDAKAWDPQLTLSVNISPIQLRDPWFSQKLLKLLVESNFPAQRLEIEITESCVHENIGAVRVLLASLKNQGIRISLDDFGTGYSSIGQLRELPFDCIKIDRSFVMGLAEDEDSATLMRTITALGEGLGLPMTAEGIESEAVLERLQAYGDFKGQGYLYGQPETAAATLERLGALDLLQTPAHTQPAERQAVQASPKRSASQG